MNELLSNTINIFITVDQQTINSYFNQHDPRPIYKRQLSHNFEQYLLTCIAPARRYSVVFYKLKCTNSLDKQFAEPLMYAIRDYFSVKKKMRELEFKRYKKRNYILLIVSLAIIVVFQGLMPLVLDEANAFQMLVLKSLDIISWVVLWRPIDKLAFDWNPHLKEISKLNKLATAEMMLLDAASETVKKENVGLFAVMQAG